MYGETLASSKRCITNWKRSTGSSSSLGKQLHGVNVRRHSFVALVAVCNFGWCQVQYHVIVDQYAGDGSHLKGKVIVYCIGTLR